MSDDDVQLSAHLTRVLAELRLPRAVRQVRLGRVAEWRYYRENPGRRKARTKQETESLAEWLAGEIGRSQSSAKNILTRGRRIPMTVLKALDRRGGLKGPGILLDKLADAFNSAKGEPVEWERIVAEHQDGPSKPVPQPGALMAPGVNLLNIDSQDGLEMMADGGYSFDCILVDPPYGIRRRGAKAGEMADDREGSLWCVPMLARLIKPGRALCLWTSSGVAWRWAKALLDAGLVVADAIVWDKGAYHEKRGDETMLIAAKGSLPATFNDDDAKRWEGIPTLPSNHPLRKIHPSPKPPELMERAIARFTQPGETVLDAFIGTGPVGVAAVRMGRQYEGYDIEPKFIRAAKGEIKQALVDIGALPANVPRVLVAPSSPDALRNHRRVEQEAGEEGED